MNEKGLSIIENIAAVLVIAVASGALIVLLTSQLRAAKDNGFTTTAWYLALEKSETLYNDGYHLLTSEAWAAIPGFSDFSCEVYAAQVSDGDFSTEVVWGTSNTRKFLVSVIHERVRTVEVKGVCGKP